MLFVQQQYVLKGSYDVAKKNIILCIWCNTMCLCGLRLKKHIIFHIPYIIVAPLCPAFLKHVDFYKLIVQRSKVCSDWSAIQCFVIGRIPQAWDGNVTTPYRIVMPCPDIKTIKPIINEVFVASSGDIFTDYNDFLRIAPRKHNHVCICDRRRNDKQQALLYTAQNSCLNSQWQIL